MSGLADYANEVGLDRVDREVIAWIDDGVYDSSVVQRYETINSVEPVNLPEDYIQDFHRAFHKEGPYGYEFCGRCDGILRKYL